MTTTAPSDAPEARSNPSHWRLGLVVALLLFAYWLRAQHLVAFVEWHDEIWSVWQIQGGLDAALSRTPYDWPPGYALLTWVWMQVAGAGGQLELFRALSLWFGMLALVFVYRAMRALDRFAAPGQHARGEMPLLALAVYAALAYAIFAAVDVRAYGPLLALGALSVWLALRWLARPSWRRGAGLALSLAAMLYLSFTAFAFIAYLTVFIAALRPRAALRWLGVGAAVLALALPVLPQFISGISRTTDVMPQPPPPFLDAMLEMYQEFGGSPWFVGAFAAALMSALVMVARRRPESRVMLLLAAWVLFPVVVYFVLDNREFLKPRYMWWVAPGLALFIAYAGRLLPRLAAWGAVAFFLLLPLAPVDFNMYRLARTESPPLRQTFAWLRQNIRPGDVMVIDPHCHCGQDFGWDLFLPQVFPGGLPLVERPGDQPRVWYLATVGEGWPRDENLAVEVEAGRKASIFYGPWFFLLRLYEAPPLREGVSFDDKIALHGAEILGSRQAFRENDTINLRLWWSARQPLDADYSFSLAVLDRRGRLVFQADLPPQAPDTPAQTSAWIPGIIYEDYRSLDVPLAVESAADYRLVLAVYQWWDGVRLAPQDNLTWRKAGEGGTYLLLERISIVTY